MYHLHLNHKSKTPKYKQIVESIITDIERGLLKKNDQLPSISEMSAHYDLARDTVEKAYRELRERGFIVSVQGKGYYVSGGNDGKLRILLIFNKLSSYKRLIYYSFLQELGERAQVDLQVHHYNAKLFADIIDRNLGKYNHYVVMPHFVHDLDKVNLEAVMQTIPAEELFFLDKDYPNLPTKHSAVFQDFQRDIFNALLSANELLQKYQQMVLVMPSDGNYPTGIARGFHNYCVNYKKTYRIIETATDDPIQVGTVYCVIEETDLAELIKKIRQTKLQMGQNIGLISFNDTTLKEVLDITVITTDFEAMGRTAAQLLLERKQEKVKNPFYLVRRGSL
ncbi:MAG: GntR family transcriptional regulator [Haliscomenobacter sp.]|uniref:GntR family transcriptional regulator n=1 Tax=Haliscomenobacter sp. TaxID=2717303 RepID=UPI0029B1A4CD|nr:GntR family transcriptional regulator [Haliscomenobacter sp.]MDX2067149.1 GntR family transcriptional regulator [Haliscomenobacter sp.]